MSLVRTIRSAIMRRMADTDRLQRQRERLEAARRRAGRPHEVHYFHQPDDPYSRLAVQVLPAFLRRYDIQLLPHIVAQATPIAIHDPVLWATLARRDCAAMAPHYGLRFVDGDREASPEIGRASCRERVYGLV